MHDATFQLYLLILWESMNVGEKVETWELDKTVIELIFSPREISAWSLCLF